MTIVTGKLGDLVNIRTGKLDVNAGSPDGQYPFFTCAKEPYKIDIYDYDCECVLVAGNGDLNVKYFNGKFNAYQRTYIVEPKDTRKLSTKFLFFFLNSYIEKLRANSIGGVIKYIKLNHLTDIYIPILELHTQDQIVKILEQADTLRQQCQQMEQELNALAQSVFLDMFGDPVTNSHNLKSVKLSELVSVTSGATPSTTNDEYWSGDYPWVSPKDMKKNYISDSIDHISEMVFEKTTLKKIIPDSILIVVRGMILVHTVPIAMNKTTIAINQDIKSLVVINDSIIPFFLFWCLKCQEKHILSKVSTAAHGTKKLDMEDLVNLEILLPEKSEQNAFYEKIQICDNQINIYLDYKSKIDILFSALMQKAFNGHLNIEAVA